eukprot:837951-Karenia_brevis.AAC.1
MCIRDREGKGPRTCGGESFSHVHVVFLSANMEHAHVCACNNPIIGKHRKIWAFALSLHAPSHWGPRMVPESQ